ncbi:MAG: tetratricopeptide repeat protein [Candidatus Omnitrophota bacterium]
MKNRGFRIFSLCFGFILLNVSMGQTDTTGSTDKTGDVLSAFNELKTAHPEKSAVIYEILADNFAQDKDFAQALNFYQQALELKPGDEGILTKLANIYQAQNMPEDVIAVYRKLVSLYPNNSFYYERLSNLLEKEGKSKDVEGVWEKLIANNPYSIQAYRQSALYFAAQKNYQKAVEQMQKAIQLRPDEVSLRFQLASILSQAGRIEEAGDAYNEIINSDQGAQIKQNAINQLVILKKQNKELASFITQIESELSKSPGDINVQGMLAQAYFIDGNLDKAVDVYKKIIEQMPSERENYNRLIEIYSNQDNLKEISVIFEAMLKIWPKDLSLYQRLARNYQKDNNAKLAIKTYERILEVSPNNPAYLFKLSELLINEKQWVQAEEKLAVCVSLQPKNKQYQEKLQLAKDSAPSRGRKAGREKAKETGEKKKPWWKRIFGW